MKPSFISLGFRSLASRLHSQVPLDSREARQLLNNLTKAFRDHLNQVHGHESDAVPNAQRRLEQSSQAQPGPFRHDTRGLIDQHLASVLTSPLFSNHSTSLPVFNYKTAEDELRNGETVDPFELLKKYQARKCATVRIAELCLRTFKERISALSIEEQQQAISTTRPGTRIASWLSNFGSHDTDLYRHVASGDFVDLLIEFLCQEDREVKLWKWLRTDVPGLSSRNASPDSAGEDQSTATSKAVYRLNVRDVMLTSLVKFRLGASPKSLDAALDTFFRARSTQFAVEREGSTMDFSLHHLYDTISATWRTNPDLITRTDPALINKLLDYAGRCAKSWHISFDRAILCLRHPTHASVGPAYAVLESLFKKSTRDRQDFIEEFSNEQTTEDENRKYELLLEIARCLHQTGNIDQSRWVVAKIKVLLAARSKDVENEVKQWQDTMTRLPASRSRESRDREKSGSSNLMMQGIQPSFG